jgi:hypothetical protein
MEQKQEREGATGQQNEDCCIGTAGKSRRNRIEKMNCCSNSRRENEKQDSRR